MQSHLDKYLEDLKSRGFSDNTKRKYGEYLRDFSRYVRENLKKTKVTEITKKDVEKYQNFLFYRRKANGEKLSVNTQIGFLGAVRTFFDFLVKGNKILINPAREVELPRGERKVGRRALKTEEIDRLFSVIDHSEPTGYRDRVILELLYSTGIRVSEIIELRVKDVLPEEGLLYVAKGKGNKDRYVPLCESMKEYLKEYLIKVRPLILEEKEDSGYLFLNNYGGRIKRISKIEKLVRQYRKLAGIKDAIGPHHFRVTCATMMLKGGASERYVQELLGHSQLETTERYLEVLTDEVKNEHARFHPREN